MLACCIYFIIKRYVSLYMSTAEHDNNTQATLLAVADSVHDFGKGRCTIDMTQYVTDFAPVRDAGLDFSPSKVEESTIEHLVRYDQPKYAFREYPRVVVPEDATEISQTLAIPVDKYRMPYKEHVQKCLLNTFANRLAIHIDCAYLWFFEPDHLSKIDQQTNDERNGLYKLSTLASFWDTASKDTATNQDVALPPMNDSGGFVSIGNMYMPSGYAMEINIVKHKPEDALEYGEYIEVALTHGNNKLTLYFPRGELEAKGHPYSVKNLCRWINHPNTLGEMKEPPRGPFVVIKRDMYETALAYIWWFCNESNSEEAAKYLFQCALFNIKRSLDYGQVATVKACNAINSRDGYRHLNLPHTLITCDRLCFMKAVLDDVPSIYDQHESTGVYNLYLNKGSVEVATMDEREKIKQVINALNTVLADNEGEGDVGTEEASLSNIKAKLNALLVACAYEGYPQTPLNINDYALDTFKDFATIVKRIYMDAISEEYANFVSDAQERIDLCDEQTDDNINALFEKICKDRKFLQQYNKVHQYALALKEVGDISYDMYKSELLNTVLGRLFGVYLTCALDSLSFSAPASYKIIDAFIKKPPFCITVPFNNKSRKETINSKEADLPIEWIMSYTYTNNDGAQTTIGEYTTQNSLSVGFGTFKLSELVTVSKIKRTMSRRGTEIKSYAETNSESKFNKMLSWEKKRHEYFQYMIGVSKAIDDLNLPLPVIRDADKLNSILDGVIVNKVKGSQDKVPVNKVTLKTLATLDEKLRGVTGNNIPTKLRGDCKKFAAKLSLVSDALEEEIQDLNARISQSLGANKSGIEQILSLKLLCEKVAPNLGKPTFELAKHLIDHVRHQALDKYVNECIVKVSNVNETVAAMLKQRWTERLSGGGDSSDDESDDDEREAKRARFGEDEEDEKYSDNDDFYNCLAKAWEKEAIAVNMLFATGIYNDEIDSTSLQLLDTIDDSRPSIITDAMKHLKERLDYVHSLMDLQQQIGDTDQCVAMETDNATPQRVMQKPPASPSYSAQSEETQGTQGSHTSFASTQPNADSRPPDSQAPSLPPSQPGLNSTPPSPGTGGSCVVQLTRTSFLRDSMHDAADKGMRHIVSLFQQKQCRKDNKGMLQGANQYYKPNERVAAALVRRTVIAVIKRCANDAPRKVLKDKGVKSVKKAKRVVLNEQV